jgi:AraC-like DNA-binding protein
MRQETFTTSHVPAPQQFDAWMDWLGGIADILPHHSPLSGFQAESQSWQIGGCMVSRVRAPALWVERQKTHIRRYPLHHWVITLSRRTTSSIGSGNVVPPGTPVVLSLADELTCERAEDERLQLYISRDKFADLAPVLERGTALNTPLGSLLGDYLVLLARILPDVGPDELPRLGDAIEAMVAACLAPGQDRACSAEPQIDLVRRERVRDVVRKYLRSPRLSPLALCHLLSLSRSKLYRLMDAEDGVARYIQRQRLIDAYALLSDPSNDRPIRGIAEELCFPEMSGFSRAFRREFDCSPRDVRTARRQDAPRTQDSDVAGRSLRSLLSAL